MNKDSSLNEAGKVNNDLAWEKYNELVAALPRKTARERSQESATQEE